MDYGFKASASWCTAHSGSLLKWSASSCIAKKYFKIQRHFFECCRQISQILKLPNHSTELLEATQLDYYVGCFWWSKEQGFTVLQTSAFFTAAHTLLCNIKGENC